MSEFLKSLQAFWADEEGVTGTEHGLLASLMAVVTVVPATAADKAFGRFLTPASLHGLWLEGFQTLMPIHPAHELV